MSEIAKWIKEYADNAGCSTLVVGVSGGVDSAVTSTLCALTGNETVVVSMPIHQAEDQLTLAKQHIEWLTSNHPNVSSMTLDLSATYDCLSDLFKDHCDNALGLANSRARLRMTALYQVATSRGGLVVGTGNRVEDFGVGFFTKYGDGGVDISPIAHLMKSEVRALAKDLRIIDDIVTAPPTDGLWRDSRTDEEQLGATYDELEWAMQYDGKSDDKLTDRQREVLNIYEDLHKKNHHKMIPIPTFSKM